MRALGQTPNTEAPNTDKTDRAAVYYYYATAHMYALAAVNPDGTTNTENVTKAIENYRAALELDSQAEIVGVGLRQMIQHGRLLPLISGIPPKPIPPKPIPKPFLK